SLSRRPQLAHVDASHPRPSSALFSCLPDSPVFESGRPEEAAMADNRDVIETMIAAANRNDFDAQLACFSPDAEYRFDTYGIAARGPRGNPPVRGSAHSYFPRPPDRHPADHLR